MRIESAPLAANRLPTADSQQFVFASSDEPFLKKNDGCAGTTDPVATTFDQIYGGKFRYLVWNDQFYQEPKIRACSANSCGGPWGHSKGVLAWNDEGEGILVDTSHDSFVAGHRQQKI